MNFLKFLSSKINKDDGKSFLDLEKLKIDKGLNKANENNNWEKVLVLNFKMKWITFLEKEVSSQFKNQKKELDDSDLKLPLRFDAFNNLHVNFSSEVIADVGDELSNDHIYKKCYYKPMTILPYPTKSILKCGKFLWKYHSQEIAKINKQDYSDDIKILNTQKHIRIKEAVEFTFGSLLNIIPIEPSKLPTDPIENEKVGKRFIDTRKASNIY